MPLRVGGKSYIVATEKLSAISKTEVAAIIGNVADKEYDIRRALDIVFMGV